jgi:RNA polymerase sigma-70 factor (sigma-E family)
VAISNSDFIGFMRDRQQPLLRFAMVLTGDPRLAEDIVCDVLSRAWEKWARISAIEEPNAYLRRMIVNDFLSWRRRVQRTSPQGDLIDLLDETQAGDPDYATTHAERHALVGELGQLPRKQQVALALRFYEGMSYAEIAQVMHCEPATVRSNVARALANLRIRMREEAPERSLKAMKPPSRGKPSRSAQVTRSAQRTNLLITEEI